VPTAAATVPLYIVVFSLDTTAPLRQNPRQHSSVTGEFGSAPLRPAPQKRAVRRGETICSTCPASPCNALIRSAKHEATGFAPTLPARLATKAVAPAAAIPCATSHRHSAHAFACAHVHSRQDHRCGLVPANPTPPGVFAKESASRERGSNGCRRSD
jgi:hypothetical protein